MRSHRNWAGLQSGGWQSSVRNTYTVYFHTLTVGMETSNSPPFSNFSLTFAPFTLPFKRPHLLLSPPQFNLLASLIFPLICSFLLKANSLCFTSIRLSGCHLTTITLGISTDGILCWINAAAKGMERTRGKTQEGRRERVEKEKRAKPGWNELVLRGFMEGDLLRSLTF